MRRQRACSGYQSPGKHSRRLRRKGRRQGDYLALSNGFHMPPPAAAGGGAAASLLPSPSRCSAAQVFGLQARRTWESQGFWPPRGLLMVATLFLSRRQRGGADPQCRVGSAPPWNARARPLQIPALARRCHGLGFAPALCHCALAAGGAPGSPAPGLISPLHEIAPSGGLAGGSARAAQPSPPPLPADRCRRCFVLPLPGREPSQQPWQRATRS